MFSSDFILDAKSIQKLSTCGLPSKLLKQQVGDDLDFLIELWHAQGLEIVKKGENFYFATKFISIEDGEFCIVDIETNGSKIDKHQIIEIAAVKIKNMQIIDKFESFVHCKEINHYITDITGISAQDTQHAPNLKEVMYEFKKFLGDGVLVAHDAKFDYKFISLSMQKIGLAPLLNRSLCSLSLAERTIESYRYALSYLNKLFNLHPEARHHRAMSDVLTTYELFKLSVLKLDKTIKSVDELIKFSKESKRLKRPKFDPFLEKELKEETEDSSS